MTSKAVTQSLRDQFEVPPHIEACANAIRYDLTHGPTWARIPARGMTCFTDDDYATFPEDLDDRMEPGDTKAETYCSLVADTLRDWLDSFTVCYVDADGEYLGGREPQGEYLDEDGEPCEDDAESATYYAPYPYYECGPLDITRALFGDTIANEFR